MTDSEEFGVFGVFAEAVEPYKERAKKLIDMVIDGRDAWKAFAESPSAKFSMIFGILRSCAA